MECDLCHIACYKGHTACVALPITNPGLEWAHASAGPLRSALRLA
jgi:hypothetical protein